jgi:arylsulfatase A-like enzyme
MASERTSVGLFEFIGLAVAAGLLVSGAFTCLDVLSNARTFPFIDVLVALGLTAILVVPVTFLLFMGTAFVLRFFTSACDRQAWVPVVMVSTTLLSLMSIVGLLQMYGQVGIAIVVGLATIPAALLVCGLTAASDWMLKPWRGFLGLLGATAALLLGTCAMTTSGLQQLLSFVLIGGLFLCVCSAALPTGRLRWLKHTVAGCSMALLALFGWSYFASSLKPARAPAAQTEGSMETPPNVVLVVLDTTRRDHIGVYGRDPSLTPRLDEFARDGVVYDNAFATAPWTIPSHASLFTGLFPVSHGCSNEHHLWLDDDFRTLAEMLQDAGYETVALNSNPYMTQGNMFQGFDQVEYLRAEYDQLAIRRIALTLGVPERWVDKGSSNAVKALGRWLNTRRSSTKPFFMFLNLYEAHRKYVPPRDERDQLAGDGMNALNTVQFGLQFNPLIHEIEEREDAHAAPIVKRLYEAEVRYQDRRLGEWLDLLDRRVDLDNSLVIVTADHGENLGEHGRWEHMHQINDALIHVPLIVRYPKAEEADQRVTGLCQLTDILPTVMDVLGLEHDSETLPGRTLHPQRFEPHAAVYAEVAPYYPHFPLINATLGFKAGLTRFNRHRRVFRTESLKYIWSSNGEHELFDVSRDPGEVHNNIAYSADEARVISEGLEEFLARLPKYTLPAVAEQSAPSEPLDSRTLRRLRSLGYIGG